MSPTTAAAARPRSAAVGAGTERLDAAGPRLPQQRAATTSGSPLTSDTSGADPRSGNVEGSLGTLLRQGLVGKAATAWGPAALVVRLIGVAGARDELGLAQTDAVLQTVVDDLELSHRGSTLMPGGPDEIIALLPAASDPEGAAQALLLHLHGALAQAGLSLVRAHAGLALYDEQLSADDLLRRARASAEQAERQRTAVHLFEHPRDDALLSRHRDADLLRNSIAHGRLLVHYQRLVARAQPQPGCHLEALVRWEVDGQVRQPAQFLPLAEEAGLMPALSALVLEQVLSDVAAWNIAGQHVCVAVNVPAHVLTCTFLDELTGRMDDAGLQREQISLEVTEAELIDQAARDALHRCRELDMHVAVDDFGTGYSALGYLLDVPVTTIKIDRSLVTGVVVSPARRSVLRHCVALAHQLGLQVVAEGVETHAEHDEVLAIGADWIQGFYVHRPAPAAAALP